MSAVRDQRPAAASGTVHYERQGAVAVITIDNPPLNAGSTAIRAGLVAALARLAADDGARAAILAGAGKTFMAGSDLTEFGKPINRPTLPEVIAAIEDCPKPVIAAIHGVALGGGLELVLGCDARVAEAGTTVGLPEVTLGMIPGAGGTQRLPRLAGLAAALELAATGRRIEATEALELGILDRVFEGDLLVEAARFAEAFGTAKRRVRDMDVPASVAAEVDKAKAAALKAGCGREAVCEAVAAVESSIRLPVGEALLAERATFERLRMGPEAHALRYVFFAERTLMKQARQRAAQARGLSRIGVVGAGTMGSGIALASALAGYQVILVDKDEAALDNARTRIEAASADLSRIGQAPAALEAARQRISLTTELRAVAASELVVEAVFEDIDVKAGTLRDIAAATPHGTVIATNTSYLDIEALAAASGRPSDVIGLHFFAPVHRMALAEVVRTSSSSDAAVGAGFLLATRMDKLPVLAGVRDGFIGNAIHFRYRQQCEYMLEEGALPEEIDRAAEDLGFAMGVFAVSDLCGLDIAWAQRKRRAATRDRRERYVDIPDRLCEMGRLGRKSGAGWYSYADPSARKGAVDPVVTELVRASTSDRLAHPIDSAAMKRRILGAIVNEAALLLEDGIAESAEAIDMVMIRGYGFSRFTGGPLHLASTMPTVEILLAVDEVEAATGFGFRRGDVQRLLAPAAEPSA